MCFITFVNVDQEDEEFYNPVTSVGAFLTVQGHVSTVTSLVFCPSGLMLASGCDRGWLNIWSICVSALFCYYFTELVFFFTVDIIYVDFEYLFKSRIIVF